MKWLPLVLLALCLGGCGGTPEKRFEFSQIVMGVAARVELYAPDEPAARAAAAAAFARMADLEAIMSDYRPDSELMRLCAGAGGPPVRVSADLMRVMVLAQSVSAASGGAFDVTVGPLVLLWRGARRTGDLPSDSEIAEAMSRVGYRHVIVDEKRGTIRLEMVGMRLDLGGVGKCFAADEAVRLLRARGNGRCLVAVGGDIVAGNSPPGRAGWKVAVELPDGSTEVMTIADRAVSSSGSTEQFVEFGGQRYSHIVDPRTGLGLTTQTGATVVASDGATADALATAVCVLGAKAGRGLVDGVPGASVEVFDKVGH